MTFMKTENKFLGVLFLGVLLLFLLVSGKWGYTQQDTLPKDLVSSDGRLFTKEALDSGVVVLNFWFLACGPCINEIPHLKAVSKRFIDNYNILFIAISPYDSQEQLTYFKKRNDFGYHLVVDDSSWTNFFDISLYPTNIILLNGEVAYRNNGYSAYIEKELTMNINRLLKRL